MNRLTNNDYILAARLLNCEVACVKSIREVEALNSGFLPNGEVKILFERHKFHQFTGGKYSRKYIDISNPRSGGYKGGYAEHRRLQKAVRLNRTAALKSASWGAFQIMGFNYRLCGFTSLQAFINAMHKGEREQLFAFVNFVKSVGLDDELRRKDWKGFAKGYNGRAYYENKYDVKLQRAYKKYSK